MHVRCPICRGTRTSVEKFVGLYTGVFWRITCRMFNCGAISKVYPEELAAIKLPY